MKVAKKKVKKQEPPKDEFHIEKYGDNEFIVRISEFNGKLKVDAREYFKLDGKQLPTKKGMNMSPYQARQVAEALLACADLVDEREQEAGN